MNLPRLFAILIALSLLFGPLAMDRAMAAAPATHARMADDGHCQPGNEGKAGTAMPDSCCVATATALDTPTVEIRFTRLAAIAATPNFRRGVLSELSTPPPRPA